MSRDDHLARLRAQFGPIVEVLDDGDPWKKVGQSIGDRVTALVGYLSFFFPNEHVNQLMAQVWNLIGSATILVAIGPVRTPSSAVLVQAGQPVMVILVPPDWATTSAADHTMAVGALIFCGSQAVDYYNGRLLENKEEASVRARAYEVEALRVFRDTDPTWVPNDYQANILRQFPDGIATESVVLYDPKSPPYAPPPVFVAES